MPRRMLDSHLAAARRRDVGYRLLTEADLPGWDGAGLQAAAAKLLAFRFTAARDVLLLDADAPGQPRCAVPVGPPGRRRGGAARHQLAGRRADGGGRAQPGASGGGWAGCWATRALPLGPLEAYGNTGFVLAGRRWQGLLEEAFALALHARLPWMEQTPLNYLLRLQAPRCAGSARSGTAPTHWSLALPDGAPRLPLRRPERLMRQVLG